MCIHLTTQNMLCCKTWPLSLQGMLQVSVNTLIGGEMFVQHTTGGWSMSLATKPGQTSFKQEYYSIYLTHKEKIGRQSLDYWVSLAKYLSAVNTQNVVKWHCLEKCGLIPLWSSHRLLYLFWGLAVTYCKTWYAEGYSLPSNLCPWNVQKTTNAILYSTSSAYRFCSHKSAEWQQKRAFQWAGCCTNSKSSRCVCSY